MCDATQACRRSFWHDAHAMTPPTPHPSPDNDARRLTRVDSVDLANVLPSVTLFGSFHAALRPARLLFACVLLLALVATGRLWDGLSPATYDPAGLFAGALRESQLVDAQESARSLVLPALSPDQRARASTASLDDLALLLRARAATTLPGHIDAATFYKLAGTIEAARPRASFEALDEAVRTAFFSALRALCRADGSTAVAALEQLIVEIPTTSWRCAPWFTAYFSLSAVVLILGCGGVLCRLNAGDLSRREWTLRQARAFIRPRLSSLVGAPIFALVLALLLWIPVWVVGLLLSLPFFNILGGLLFGPALVFSALSSVLLTVLWIGLPLIAPAVACDGCDAVESVQRAGAYIFKRPLHLLWYATLSFLIIAAGGLVADAVSIGAWSVAISAFGGAHAEPALAAQGSLRFLEPFGGAHAAVLGTTDALTASLLEVWRTILSLLVGAATVSIAIACATRSYLLVRMQCDGQEVSDLWIDTDLKDLQPDLKP